MQQKERIIHEIHRIAEELGRAPGEMLFERKTGIKKSEWHGSIWRSWSDAIKEAGLKPNGLNQKFSDEELLSHYADLVRELGRVPAAIDLRIKAKQNDTFPSHNAFLRAFKGKPSLVRELSKFVRKKENYSDLVELLPLDETTGSATDESNELSEGYVYLLKSGKHYKIGRSDELERRVKQIAVGLPEAVILEHAIKTDDPSGIEAYWHRRFANKRANGEWFKLTATDLRAFKRRKFQ